MRNIRGKPVEMKGRNECNDRSGNAGGYREKVGLNWWRQISKSVDPAADTLQDPGVSECIQVPRMDSSP
jgi:hypothetical protein